MVDPQLVRRLIQCAGPRWQPYFYRTQDGAEIDLLLERGGQPEIAIEVKLALRPLPRCWPVAPYCERFRAPALY